MTAPATAAAAPPKTRLSLAGPQRLGRSLMLPIAALPVAGAHAAPRPARPARRRRPRLGPGRRRRRPPRGGALFANLPLLFARRRRHRHGARRPTGRRRWPPSSATSSSRASATPMSPFVLAAPGRGGGPGADQLRRARRHRRAGSIAAYALAALLPHHAAALPRVLRRPPLRADRHRVRHADRRRRAARLVYPAFDAGLTASASGSPPTPSSAAFVYGTANRLLIPLGLHHILNSVPWFILGDYTNPDRHVVHGDIARFLAGDPTAGAFMTGFFPIMMFALPAAALAIWQEASPSTARLVGGIMLSAALTVLPHRRHRAARVRLHVRRLAALRHPRRAHRHVDGAGQRPRHQGRLRVLGAGAVRLRAQLRNIATQPLLLIPIGLGYAVVYYLLFRFVIRRWNLRTPGRELENDTEATEATSPPSRPRPPERRYPEE